MSYHYSKYKLNTYSTTPYFRAHMSPDYPIEEVLISCRSFQRLPPNLQELAKHAKQWAVKNYPHPAGILGIEEAYDDEGYELNPSTKKRLTDTEIDAEWDALGTPKIDNESEVDDIPIPPGGFADPDTWEPPPVEEEEGDTEPELREEDIVNAIKYRGAKYTARYYGIDGDWSDDDRDNKELVREIMKSVRGVQDAA